MTSLNAANLPSDDEEDDDYDPSRDELASAENVGKAKGSQSNKKRRRGGTASVPDLQTRDPPEDTGLEEFEDIETPVTSAKKAKVDQLWAQLNKGKAPKQPAVTSSKATAQEATPVAPDTAPVAKPISLASFCRPVASTRKADSDADWKRQLGIKSRPDTTPPDEDSKQRAAAAAAAAQASLLNGNVKQTVTETRRFAGKDIEYTRAASEQDEKAKKAQAIKQGGLDNLLSSLEQARKVNVLDKSRMDWGQFKTANTKVEEELEGYKKSGDKYLDKVDFLQRAELRQYEKERDQRLSQDMRSRGRL